MDRNTVYATVEKFIATLPVFDQIPIKDALRRINQGSLSDTDKASLCRLLLQKIGQGRNVLESLVKEDLDRLASPKTVDAFEEAYAMTTIVYVAAVQNLLSLTETSLLKTAEKILCLGRLIDTIYTQAGTASRVVTRVRDKLTQREPLNPHI